MVEADREDEHVVAAAVVELKRGGLPADQLPHIDGGAHHRQQRVGQLFPIQIADRAAFQQHVSAPAGEHNRHRAHVDQQRVDDAFGGFEVKRRNRAQIGSGGGAAHGQRAGGQDVAAVQPGAQHAHELRAIQRAVQI